MTESKSPKAASSGPMQLNLVNSSRLQALRRQVSATQNETNKQPGIPKASAANSQQEQEDAQLRLLVDQHLAEILAQLPPGKQHSLFKIRYGIALDELKALPAKRIAEILKIRLAKR